LSWANDMIWSWSNKKKILWTVSFTNLFGKLIASRQSIGLTFPS
jgi:hypothetical protein